MEDERSRYGGQAVIEGVMMRSPRFFSIACRRLSDNGLVVRVENVESSMKGFQWLNKPFLRGTLALIDAAAMGYRALTYSAAIQIADDESVHKATDNELPAGASVAAVTAVPTPMPRAADVPHYTASKEELEVAANVEKPINNIAIGATAIVAMAFSIGLFWVVPTLVTQGAQHLAHWNAHDARVNLGLNLGDGLIRIALFLGYIALISRMAHVKRLFQYHGAEHKAINALEAGGELTLENARNASRIHPRCGTNFIFIVLIVGIIVFSCFGRPPVYIRIPMHLLLLPIVAGISFEILKFAGAHRHQKWAQALVAPGLATQYLTTRVPMDDQIEVALAALRAVWDKEHSPAEPAMTTNEIDEPAAAVA